MRTDRYAFRLYQALYVTPKCIVSFLRRYLTHC